MKKILLSTVMGCMMVFGFAQEKTNTIALQSIANTTKETQERDLKKALELAKQKNWEIFNVSKEGIVTQLVGVYADGTPKYKTTFSNVTAAITTGAAQLWQGGRTGFNLSGSSTSLRDKIAIWDGGRVYSDHQELTGKITQKDAPTSISDHASHVAGTMIGRGVNPIAKGMSFGALGIIAYDFNNDNSEMATEAANLLVSNHSYGAISGWRFNSGVSPTRWEFWGRNTETEDYKFGWYDNDAATWDAMAFNAPNYLIVKSAGNSRNQNGPNVGSNYWRFNVNGTMADAGARPGGISNNDGYDIISTDGNAKNILTVGAINGLPYGYTKPSDVVISNFSSWGPTDDGRIKPDIVAMGVAVTSVDVTSPSAYQTINGTSMSAPNASGSLFLLQELYNKLRSGQFLRSATLKGIAIHTAEEAGTTPGPDYIHGWGLLNVEKGGLLIDEAVRKNNGSTSVHLMDERLLTQGQTYSINVIASGNGKLKATICWTDSAYAGLVNNDAANNLNNRDKKLVNDLDLKIRRVGGTTTLPWTLDVNNPSNAAVKGDNILDNVEVVEIDSVMPGATYTIEVSHKGTLANNRQFYSLLVSGVGGTAYCASTATNNAGTKIDSVSIGNTLRRKMPSGCTTYTNNLSITAPLEQGATVPFAINTASCDASNNNRIAKIFIDFNNNGSFADAGETVATSGNLTNSNPIFTGNITMPTSIAVGNYLAMRIVVQETSSAASVVACGNYSNGETQDIRIEVTAASNDMAAVGFVNPVAGSCANNQATVTVTVANRGTTPKQNVPVTTTILNGAATVATLNGTIPNTIVAGGIFDYTFANTFNAASGINYTIRVTVNDATDQFSGNNTFEGSVAIATTPNAPAGTAIVCSPTNAQLRVTNPNNNLNYFWHTTAVATNPIAIGASTFTSTVPTNNTFFISNGASANVGLATKGTNFGGGYLENPAQAMDYSSIIPLILESVRVYSKNGGSIRVISGTPTTNGVTIENEVIVQVPTTSPTPATGTIAGNDLSDNGTVIKLDLPLPVGSKRLFIVGTGGVSLFRNNDLTGNTYPTGPSFFQLTGNNATPANSFYYYLYDMKIRTLDCPSARASVVATVAPTPTISLINDSLVSSSTSGNQWYLNSNPISGATDRRYKPTQSGNYSVIVSDAGGCQKESAMLNYTATAVINVSNDEIALAASPNPNNGNFRVSFKVNTRATLQISVIDITGKTIYGKQYNNFIGNFAEQLQVGKVASGNYILKVQHGNRVYRSNLFITP